MYNQKEIDKNVALIGDATKECLEKLARSVIPPEKVLEIEIRLVTNFELVDTAMASLERYLPDRYIERKMRELDSYKRLWEDYKSREGIGESEPVEIGIHYAIG